MWFNVEGPTLVKQTMEVDVIPRVARKLYELPQPSPQFHALAYKNMPTLRSSFEL
jgi:hypothetical protein